MNPEVNGATVQQDEAVTRLSHGKMLRRVRYTVVQMPTMHLLVIVEVLLISSRIMEINKMRNVNRSNAGDGAVIHT